MRSKTNKRLLVTGTARNGSRHLAKALMLAGVDIGHERIKVNGTICSHLAVEDYWYSFHWRQRSRGLRRSDLTFDEVWHQIRHPLKVIESIEFGPNLEFWHFQEKHTGISWDDKPIERIARYWLAWNEIVEKGCGATLRYRVEDMPWDEMMDRLGLAGTEKPEVPNDYGAHKLERRAVEWSELGEWEEPVRKKAAEYGYDG